MRIVRYRVAVGLVALAAVLTACHGGNRPSASPSPSASAMSDEQIVAIVREHAQCMRDHGIANFQEPRVVHGRLEGGGVPDDGTLDQAAVEAAFQACRSIEDRLPRSALEDAPVTAEELAKLERFAGCIRQHGFPDWPDPNSKGEFLVYGTPLEQALKTDQGQEAIKACRHYYDGQIKVPGPSK